MLIGGLKGLMEDINYREEFKVEASLRGSEKLGNKLHDGRRIECNIRVRGLIKLWRLRINGKRIYR